MTTTFTAPPLRKAARNALNLPTLNGMGRPKGKPPTSRRAGASKTELRDVLEHGFAAAKIPSLMAALYPDRDFKSLDADQLFNMLYAARWCDAYSRAPNEWRGLITTNTQETQAQLIAA